MFPLVIVKVGLIFIRRICWAGENVDFIWKDDDHMSVRKKRHYVSN